MEEGDRRFAQTAAGQSVGQEGIPELLLYKSLGFLSLPSPRSALNNWVFSLPPCKSPCLLADVGYNLGQRD